MNVYKEVIEQIRFGELIANYNKLNNLKQGKLNFRVSLNAGKGKTDRTTSSRKAPAATKESSAATNNNVASANAQLAIAPASSAIIKKLHSNTL